MPPCGCNQICACAVIANPDCPGVTVTGNGSADNPYKVCYSPIDAWARVAWEGTLDLPADDQNYLGGLEFVDDPFNETSDGWEIYAPAGPFGEPANSGVKPPYGGLYEFSLGLTLTLNSGSACPAGSYVAAGAESLAPLDTAVDTRFLDGALVNSTPLCFSGLIRFTLGGGASNSLHFFVQHNVATGANNVRVGGAAFKLARVSA